LKAMLEDMRRDRDAWREQAQARLLPAPAGTYVMVAVAAYDRMRSTHIHDDARRHSGSNTECERWE
jgi:hypothetical protein